MVTYEDVTEMFLGAAEATGLSVHPELWLNTQTLEREFACTLHPGPCEEAERRAACTISFAWGPLDTVLSIDGAEGVCDFFHEPDEDCPHLHTENVPPLVLDLTYNLPLDAARFSDGALRQLARTLKLRASEHSSRAVETRPNIALALGDNGMVAEAITLQQRVELPLWDPEGGSGFHASGEHRSGHMRLGRGRRAGAYGGGDPADSESGDEAEASDPHPEDWLPHLLTEVAADIAHVLETLESSRIVGGASGQDSGQNN